MTELFKGVSALLTILDLVELVKGMASGPSSCGGSGLHSIPTLALQFLLSLNTKPTDMRYLQLQPTSQTLDNFQELFFFFFYFNHIKARISVAHIDKLSLMEFLPQSSPTLTIHSYTCIPQTFP